MRRGIVLAVLLAAGALAVVKAQPPDPNAPKVVDWFGMNDKKKFIAGSNFPIDPKNLLVLQKRYKIEDYSGK